MKRGHNCMTRTDDLRETKGGLKVKKKTVLIVLAFVLLLTLLLGFKLTRKINFETGREQGYSMGYAAGHEDGTRGEERDFQIIAQEANPYQFGNSKWKGFMRGFDQGYSEGMSTAEQP